MRIAFGHHRARRALKSIPAAAAAMACALLSGCSSAKELPSKDTDAPPQRALSKTPSYSLSQSRLLDILALEQDLFSDPNIDGVSDTSRAELITKGSRIDSMWRSYILDFPEDVQALVLYGKFLRRTGREDAAYEMFKRADSMNPNIAVVHQQLSAMDAEAGEIKNSLARIRRAMELEPDNKTYMRQCAFLLAGAKKRILQQGMLSPEEYDSLLRFCYLRPCQLSPDDRGARVRYAQSMYDLCNPDYQEALRVWLELRKNAALNIDKQTADANIARALVELGRDGEALNYLEKIDLPALERAKRLLLEEIRRAKKDGLKIREN